MDCKRVREAMFLFIDNEMGDDDAGPFKAHMDACPHCAQRLGFTRKFLVLVRERCVRHSAPRRLRQRILVSLGRPPAEGGPRAQAEGA